MYNKQHCLSPLHFSNRLWECNTSYVRKRNFTVEAKNISDKHRIIVTSML